MVEYRNRVRINIKTTGGKVTKQSFHVLLNNKHDGNVIATSPSFHEKKFSIENNSILTQMQNDKGLRQLWLGHLNTNFFSDTDHVQSLFS